MAAPPWAGRALRILVLIASVDLAIQYIAGIATNAYAPSAGFTSNTDFGIYDLHFENGLLLGVLVLAVLIVAALTREVPSIGMAAVAFVAVLVAAIAGMAYVNSTPNDPLATVTMGLAFLVAFGSLQALMFRVIRPGPSAGAPPSVVPTPSG